MSKQSNLASSWSFADGGVSAPSQISPATAQSEAAAAGVVRVHEGISFGDDRAQTTSTDQAGGSPVELASANRWREIVASNPPCPRSSHQLSSLGSRIFLFGGENGPEQSHFGYGLPVPSTAVHCLDLDRPDAWTEVQISPDSADPPSARLGHGQTIIEDGDGQPFLYVFGGRQPEEKEDLENIRSLRDLHRLNLNSGVWEQVLGTGEVPSVRSYHQMVSVGSTFFLFAGMINDERYSDLYAFDTVEQHWSRLPQSPMEGRGGPGLCAIGHGANASLIVVAGFCGRPMADVWQYRIASAEWLPRADWNLPVARSIFACGVLTSDLTGEAVEICTFGGELENFDAALKEEGKDPTVQASLYSNETLLLQSTSQSSEVHVTQSSSSCPAARGWTAGCTACVGGKPCFVIFGGIREGQEEGEPSGVRLGDLATFT